MAKPNDGVFLTMGSERLNKLVAVDTAPNVQDDEGAGSSKYAEPVAAQIKKLIEKLRDISAERYAKEIQAYCDWLNTPNELAQMTAKDKGAWINTIDKAQKNTLTSVATDIKKLEDINIEESAELLKQYSEVRRICELVRMNLGCEPKLALPSPPLPLLHAKQA